MSGRIDRLERELWLWRSALVIGVAVLSCKASAADKPTEKPKDMTDGQFTMVTVSDGTQVLTITPSGIVVRGEDGGSVDLSARGVDISSKDPAGPKTDVSAGTVFLSGSDALASLTTDQHGAILLLTGKDTDPTAEARLSANPTVANLDLHYVAPDDDGAGALTAQGSPHGASLWMSGAHELTVDPERGVTRGAQK